MGNDKTFEKYKTTAFAGERDTKASYRSYEKDYGPFLPTAKEAAMLDIGCGMGELIGFLRSKGYKNVSGVDVSEEMVEFCRAAGLSCVETVTDLSAFLAKRAGAYELITLNDTIEHFPKGETVAMLKAIRGALKEDGRLLVRTGNFSTPGGMYLRYKDFTHETGYTELSLEQVLRVAGFSEVTVQGNAYTLTPNPLSAVRLVTLKLWFLVLRAIYTLELGCDRPRIYSKLLIAACKK